MPPPLAAPLHTHTYTHTHREHGGNERIILLPLFLLFLLPLHHYVGQRVHFCNLRIREEADAYRPYHHYIGLLIQIIPKMHTTYITYQAMIGIFPSKEQGLLFEYQG
jgi:hypothetical protein